VWGAGFAPSGALPGMAVACGVAGFFRFGAATGARVRASMRFAAAMIAKVLILARSCTSM
jgi:hypothetical protein